MMVTSEDRVGIDSWIDEECTRWLLDVRYWVGFVTGRRQRSDNHRSINLISNELQYRWYGYRISIEGRAGSFYKNELRCSNEFDTGKVFNFIVGDYNSVVASSKHVETLIKRHFPRISAYNTWDICSVKESELCEGKTNTSSICILVNDKYCCTHCERLLQSINAFKSPDIGNVYILGSHQEGVYKIGFSRDVKRRFKTISTKLPFDVEIYHYIACDSMYPEKLLHNLYAKYKKNGEWFSLKKEHLDFLFVISRFEKGAFTDKVGNIIALPAEVD